MKSSKEYEKTKDKALYQHMLEMTIYENEVYVRKMNEEKRRTEINEEKRRTKMSEEQFNNLMMLLIQIEFNTRKEKTSDNSVNSIIAAIRDAFQHQLEAKTGWGRNEIKDIFEAAVESVIR